MSLKRFFFVALFAVSLVGCSKKSEKRLFDAEKFAAKLETSPEWMKEQIAEDFQGFTIFSEKQVDETFAQIKKHYPHPWIIRYRILNNELYRYFPEGELISLTDNSVERALKALLQVRPLRDMDFILSYVDGVPLPEMPADFYITEKREDQAPVLFSAKVKETPYIVLVPDWRSLSEWWASDIKTVLAQDLSWEKKKETALWRGSLTRDARLEFCKLSHHNPELLDAKINIKVQDPKIQEQIEKAGLFGERVAWETFLKYKYLPILDGVCCAAPAFQWRLLSRSIALKQESNEIQWFYRALKPFVHYVPFCNDFSDLFEKLEWAKKNDAACQKIATEATQFVLNQLMMEDVYVYFYLVLDHYASLQTLNTKTMDSHWVNLHQRKELKKVAKKADWKGYIRSETPF